MQDDLVLSYAHRQALAELADLDPLHEALVGCDPEAPLMADQVPAVCDVLDAIESRNWARLERLLHPEIHWTTAVEEQLHGPGAVIARLSGDPPPAPPSYHEVRDGLMWRWIDCPG